VKMTEEGIQTFASCPDREEHWKGKDPKTGAFYGAVDSNEELCPDGSPHSMRNMDYSICRHLKRANTSHSCRIGRGGIHVGTKWCEASLCAKTCPRGFVR
jgi:hypothetical protein